MERQINLPKSEMIFDPGANQASNNAILNTAKHLLSIDLGVVTFSNLLLRPPKNEDLALHATESIIYGTYVFCLSEAFLEILSNKDIIAKRLKEIASSFYNYHKNKYFD